MREIILDTETTGVSVKDGHRIIEIGAVEVVSRMPTGKTYQVFMNPEREVDAGAARVHGITTDMLLDKPLFSELADGFLEFIEDSPIVAHNAPFDIGFLNAELAGCGKPPLSNEIIDTLPMARNKFPGARASLDALCQRFDVDSSTRTLHGALLDAELLAEVYMNLTGGLQPTLLGEESEDGNSTVSINLSATGKLREAREFPINEEELKNHKEFIATIDNSVWNS